MCPFIHLDVLWFSATFVHFELYADIFYFCFRSHFIYVTLLVIDLSIFSRHIEISFWKQHQTAKDFHWIFAKLSLLCCASHNYKMRFQHKNVSKTQNICFCSWVQWRMAYISIFLFNFFLFFPFSFDNIHKWQKYKWYVLFFCSHVKRIVFTNRYEINARTQAPGIQLVYAIKLLIFI